MISFDQPVKLVYLGQQFAGCSRVEPTVPVLKLFASCLLLFL